jgi:hypothetical protein
MNSVKVGIGIFAVGVWFAVVAYWGFKLFLGA